MKTLLVAGGSGGHLVPAIALAEHLQEDGPCHILSTSRPIDRRVAGAIGSPTTNPSWRVAGAIGSPTTNPSWRVAGLSSDCWMTVDLDRFTPLWRWFTPRYTRDQWRAVRQVREIVRNMEPDVVVGFGGYLSAVGVTAARLSGVPTVIHEQNLLPGAANRVLASYANCVAVSFPETKRHLPRGAAVEVTGNPVRSSLAAVEGTQARAAFGFDGQRPVLLVMGGSQGSQPINELVLAMWQGLPPEERRRLQVLHLAGPQGAHLEMAYRRLGMDGKVFAFLGEMQMAYSAATLALSRAGATGIAEMVALRVPALLIPYPHAGGHQLANARWMESLGGAVVVEEDRLTAHTLWEETSRLLAAPDRLNAMRWALQAQANGSALDRLGMLVKRVAR